MQRRFVTLLAAGIALLFAALPASSDIRPDKPATQSAPVDNSATDFAARKAALKPDDVAGQIELAHWACEHKLWDEAAALAREVLDKDGENRQAWAILQQVDQTVTMPQEPETESALKQEFDKRFERSGQTAFKTRNSRHFILCYDTTDAFAAQRGGLMEKAYDSFMFFFSMQKLRPQFLDKRLVVILFKNRDDYLTYAHATEGADLSWAAGYYSQRTNRTAFYDDSTGTEVQSVEKQLATLRSRLKDLNAQIDAANNKNDQIVARKLTSERDGIGKALYEINMRIGNEVGLMNAVKAVHEAAHQLAFNTGIQKRLVDYPLWFSEGLACSFEMEDHSGRRGPSVINNGRVAVVKDAIKRGKLIPLQKFIEDPQPAVMDEATMSVFYAEGWALFHYLYKTNRPGMEKYLLAYQGVHPIQAVPHDLRAKLFTDAFGSDYTELEKNFTKYLKDLPSVPRP